MGAIDLMVVQGFIAATREAIEMMAFVEVEVAGMRPIGEAPASLGVCASMLLSGQSPGRVALGFDEKTATAIVASMLEAEPSEISRDDMLDGASELANLVAGGARAALERQGTSFDLSIPQVAAASESDFAAEGPDSAMVHLRAAGGDVWLLVQMNSAD